MSSFTEKVKETMDKVLHPGDHKDTATGTSHTGTSHTGTSHTGHSHTGTGVGTGVGTGASSTNAGPHNSNLANKADPRVDSDLDSSRNTGLGHHNPGQGGLTGSSNTAGPHSSDMLNKADPRVDSDLDGSRNFGASSTGGHTSTSGTNYNNPQSGNLGPHSTATANKLDPRVDSDGDRGYGSTGGSGLTGAGGIGSTGHTGSSGLTGSSGYGTSGSGLTGSSGYGTSGTGNSGLTGSSGYGASGHTGSSGLTGTGAGGIGSTGHQTGTGIGGGPGPAPNTAGPHKSDMLNKVDPRVDSDQDGSKTMGGNPTYASLDDHFAKKDIDDSFSFESAGTPPRFTSKSSNAFQSDGPSDPQTHTGSPQSESPPDAAKHSPSQFLAKQLKDGTISREDVDTDHRRRHSYKNLPERRSALEKYGSGHE